MLTQHFSFIFYYQKFNFYLFIYLFSTKMNFIKHQQNDAQQVLIASNAKSAYPFYITLWSFNCAFHCSILLSRILLQLLIIQVNVITKSHTPPKVPAISWNMVQLVFTISCIFFQRIIITTIIFPPIYSCNFIKKTESWTVKGLLEACQAISCLGEK